MLMSPVRAMNDFSTVAIVSNAVSLTFNIYSSVCCDAISHVSRSDPCQTRRSARETAAVRALIATTANALIAVQSK